MEELVRDRAQDPIALRGIAERAPAGDHGAVAVLHAVTVRPRQIVREERVRARVELRELAENLRGLADDLLHVLDVRIRVPVRPVVVQRRSNRLRPVHPIVDGDAAERELAELRGAVHQVVDVGGREDERIVGREELRRDAPRAPRWPHKRHAGGARELAADEHHRRRHVHVRVRGVHAQVGAVRAVAEAL
jgi:hypothetical protein